MHKCLESLLVMKQPKPNLGTGQKESRRSMQGIENGMQFGAMHWVHMLNCLLCKHALARMQLSDGCSFSTCCSNDELAFRFCRCRTAGQFSSCWATHALYAFLGL